MAAFRCPHCQAVLRTLPEQPGQTIKCGECGRSVRLPAAPTEIQTTDLRLDPVPVVELAPPAPQESIKKPATDLPAAKKDRRADNDVLATSAAFRREMERFSEDRLPFLDEFPANPIPEEVPAEADRLGRAVASVSLKGDRRILGVITGAGFLLAALTCCVGPTVAWIGAGMPTKGQDLGTIALYVMYVPIFAAVGVWLTFFRKWTPPRTLWVCPRGLIWEWGPHFGFKQWHEIEDFSVSGATGRPLFWVTPAEGVDFVISAGQGPVIVPIADYIELKSAAALLPIFLRLLLAGEKVRFDRLSMEPIGIRARGQVCLWSEIGGTRLDGTAFLITDRDRQELVRLRTRDVSFPMVAQAIVRIVTEEGLLK